MKIHKLITCLAVALLVCMGLRSPAAAVNLNDPRFVDKTWEQVMEDFLVEHDISPDSVTAAFYNTVTGEEHYWNKGQYMYSASVVKLPTNMIYAERIYNGEMDWDTIVGGTKYKTIQEASLIFSNNDMQNAMVNDLGNGNFFTFRKMLLPYIGMSEEEITDEFLRRSIFTPEQMMYCLKLLYNNPEHYPGVIDNMLLANPGWYFESQNPPYEVAHKYGWYTFQGVTYINDVGIVYTDDPILLVLFTGGVDNALDILGLYCNLMCDYTQYHRALRYVEEASEPVTMTTPLHFVTVAETQARSSVLSIVLYTVAAVIVIVAIVLFVKGKRWAVALLALAGVSLWFGMQPMLRVKQALNDGTAEQVIAQFVDYHASQEHENLMSEMAANALTITPNTPVRQGADILVPVTVTRLDVDKVNADLAVVYNEKIAELAAADQSNLYNADGSFCSDTTEAAAYQAMLAVAENKDTYLTTVEGAITLRYTDSGWVLVQNEALAALCNY